MVTNGECWPRVIVILPEKVRNRTTYTYVDYCQKLLNLSVFAYCTPVVL